MAFYASRRKLRPKEHDETAGELNIIPYLDIMMNLIMFMLLSITGFVTLGIINVTAPSYSADANPTNGANNDTKPLLLTVGISKKGFFIAATGAVLPGAGGDANSPTIPKVGDKYDYTTLAEKMKAIKADLKTNPGMSQYKDEKHLILIADPDTEFDTIVHVMDATRGGDPRLGQELFPDISLAQL